MIDLPLDAIHYKGGPENPLDETVLRELESRLSELTDEYLDGLQDLQPRIQGRPLIDKQVFNEAQRSYERSLKYYVEQTSANTATLVYARPDASEDALQPLARHHGMCDEQEMLEFTQQIKTLFDENYTRRRMVNKKLDFHSTPYHISLFRLEPYRGGYQGHIVVAATELMSDHAEEGLERLASSMDSRLADLDTIRHFQQEQQRLQEGLRSSEVEVDELSRMLTANKDY